MQPLINIIPYNYYASYICYNSYLQIGKKFYWLLLLEVAIFTSYCILQLSIFRYTLRNCIKQQSLSLGMLTFRKVIQTHKKQSNATITSGFVRKKNITVTLLHYNTMVVIFRELPERSLLTTCMSTLISPQTSNSSTEHKHHFLCQTDPAFSSRITSADESWISGFIFKRELLESQKFIQEGNACCF